MSICANFRKLTAFRGRPSQYIVILRDLVKEASDATFTLLGAKSCETTICEHRLYVSEDEEATELTIIARADGESVEIPVTVEDAPALCEEFDEDNVILRFGLTSDTHVSGSWNQSRSAAKWAHFIDSIQTAAGRNEDGSTKLDAVLCCGDFIDSINSFGNVNRSVDAYGYKAAQNFRETAFIRSGLEGRDTNPALTVDEGATAVKSGFGKGIEEGVKFFYCLGNHDESGRGMSNENEKFTRVYTAEYFVAVLCGWNYSLENADPETPDKVDPSYLDYAADLLAIHNAAGYEKDYRISAFGRKYGVDGGYAYDRFKAYYGNDTEFTRDEYGLFFGNRHTVLGGIHFIAIETSRCLESAEYLEKWCKISVEEDPHKPIIVLTHEKLFHTIEACDGEGASAKLLYVLGNYPQCIVWTGHTHTTLTNETAIMSDCGFTSVEGSVLAYLSCESLAKENGEFCHVGNFCRKEDHEFGPCCLVKIDKNYNVKIERIDIHRSYKPQLGTENCAVVIRKPWIISGIAQSGAHLLAHDFTRGIPSVKSAPAFTEGAKAQIAVRPDGTIGVSFPAAVDCDMVWFYKVLLENAVDGHDRPVQYITNFFYRYRDNAEMAAVQSSFDVDFPCKKENRVSAVLDMCVEASRPKVGAVYRVCVTAFDVWGNESEPIYGEISDEAK